jgi:hypothetical protein
VGASARTSSATPSRSTPFSSGIQRRQLISPGALLTTSTRRNARPAIVPSIGSSWRSGTPAPRSGNKVACS